MTTRDQSRLFLLFDLVFLSSNDPRFVCWGILIFFLYLPTGSPLLPHYYKLTIFLTTLFYFLLLPRREIDDHTETEDRNSLTSHGSANAENDKVGIDVTLPNKCVLGLKRNILSGSLSSIDLWNSWYWISRHVVFMCGTWKVKTRRFDGVFFSFYFLIETSTLRWWLVLTARNTIVMDDTDPRPRVSPISILTA